MHHRLLGMMLAASESTGGGGGGGCGVVLATPYDDNFDCGSALDVSGARFSGANAWTIVTGNMASQAIVSDEWRVETGSSGGSYVPSGADQALPVGDWTFETSCYMTRHSGGAGYDERIGFYLAESATGKSLEFGAGQDASGPGGTWDNVMSVFSSPLGRLSRDIITSWGANYDVVLRLSRVGSTLTYEYSLNNGGSWATNLTHAQTVPFTTAPDRIGVMKNNSTPNIGPTYGYFRYFYRTA